MKTKERTPLRGRKQAGGKERKRLKKKRGIPIKSHNSNPNSHKIPP